MQTGRPPPDSPIGQQSHSLVLILLMVLVLQSLGLWLYFGRYQKCESAVGFVMFLICWLASIGGGVWLMRNLLYELAGSTQPREIAQFAWGEYEALIKEKALLPQQQ